MKASSYAFPMWVNIFTVVFTLSKLLYIQLQVCTRIHGMIIVFFHLSPKSNQCQIQRYPLHLQFSTAIIFLLDRRFLKYNFYDYYCFTFLSTVTKISIREAIIVFFLSNFISMTVRHKFTQFSENNFHISFFL